MKYVQCVRCQSLQLVVALADARGQTWRPLEAWRAGCHASAELRLTRDAYPSDCLLPGRFPGRKYRHACGEGLSTRLTHLSSAPKLRSRSTVPMVEAISLVRIPRCSSEVYIHTSQKRGKLDACYAFAQGRSLHRGVRNSRASTQTRAHPKAPSARLL